VIAAQELATELWLVQTVGDAVLVTGRTEAFSYAAGLLGNQLTPASKELLGPLMEGRLPSEPGQSWTVYAADGRSYADVTRARAITTSTAGDFTISG
jgi:hypothetical protein